MIKDITVFEYRDKHLLNRMQKPLQTKKLNKNYL